MRRRWAVLALLMAVGVAVFAVWSLTRDRAASTSAPRSAAGAEAGRHAGPPAGREAEAETTDEREQGIDEERKKAAEGRFVAVPRHPDATVRVLVNDDKGRPCVGARVRAGVVRDDVGMASPEVGTDADGRAELRVEAAETVGVHVRVGGYSRYTPATIHPQETTDLTVVMPTGARLVGVVHHAVKGPLYGVGLSAEFRKGSRTDYLHAVTDAEGRFVLEPVPPGECRVSLSLGGGGGNLKDWIKVTVEGEEIIDAGTIVVGGATIEGVVRDAATGRALPGVSINLADPARVETTTDFEGRFRFDDLTPCAYDLWVRREGYGGRSLNDVEVRAGDPPELEIALEPAAVLRLKVRDTDGRPVVGQVSLSASAGGWGGGGFVDLDESGEGRFVQLAPGRYRLQVQRNDLRGVAVEADLAPGENTVDLKVQRHVWGKGVRSLSGTVRDAVTGKALPGVRVGIMGLETYSDEAGQYVLHDLWPAKHHVWLVKEGYGDFFAPPMSLAEGEQRHADFVMEPAATVELCLRDRRGGPVAGAVQLFYRRIEGDRMGTNMTLVTDETGVVVFHRLLPGRHQMRVSVPGIGSKGLETTISSGRNEISLVLE